MQRRHRKVIVKAKPSRCLQIVLHRSCKHCINRCRLLEGWNERNAVTNYILYITQSDMDTSRMQKNLSFRAPQGTLVGKCFIESAAYRSITRSVNLAKNEPLTVIHPASRWMHWAALRRRFYPSRATDHVSSHATPVISKSLSSLRLSNLFLVFSEPCVLHYFRYNACCRRRSDVKYGNNFYWTE